MGIKLPRMSAATATLHPVEATTSSSRGAKDNRDSHRKQQSLRHISSHGVTAICCLVGALLISTPGADAFLSGPSGAIISSRAQVASENSLPSPTSIRGNIRRNSHARRCIRRGYHNSNSGRDALVTAAAGNNGSARRPTATRRQQSGCNNMSCSRLTMMMSGPPGSGDDIQREGEDGVGPVDAASANELKEPSSVAEGIAERSSREEGAEGQREEEESAALEEADVRQTAEADAVEGSVEEADEGEKKRRRKGKRPRLEGEALRDELMRREKEEEAAVLEVNTQFYRARAYKEIEELEKVWDKSELSECIRNVGTVLKGYNSIIEEYKTDFIVAKKTEKPGLRPFKIRDLKVQTCGTLAWVTCIEDMRNPYKPYPKTVQLVTNVFRKTSHGWRLARHHASDRDVPVLKGGQGGQTVSSLVGGGKGQSSNSGDPMRSTYVDDSGQVTEISARMFRVTDGEIRPMDISELSSGNINSNSNEIDDRQYISGEISITPTDDDSDADADEDVEDSDGRRTTSPVNLPPFLKKLIQDKIKAALSKKDNKAMLRGLDGIQGSELRDEFDWDFYDGPSIVKQGSSKKRDGKRETRADREAASARKDAEEVRDEKLKLENDGVVEEDEGDEADGWEGRQLTRETVAAVRKLTDAGKLEESEKRLLLAEVIRNASSDGPSMTQVAFEVLVGGKVDRDFDVNSCEEFVDQCKVLAIQLSEEQAREKRPWWKFWAMN